MHPDIGKAEESYEKIAVLSGNVGRVLKASELFKSKNAEYILLSKESRLVENYSSESKPLFLYQYYINVLVNNGVDRNSILLFGDNRNTYEEILSLSKVLKSKSSKILLVTDRYHISRVQEIIRHFNLLDKIDLFAVENNPEKLITKRQIQNYILEYFKLLNFYLVRLDINIIPPN
tara:strand:+ start:2216 stop:2743 length:528 start_codon:yes stop_codon:yes gene_type:complete